VLVVGGSGYLGQHLLAALASDAGRLDVAFTPHHSQAPPQPLLDALPPSVRAFRADLRSGDGFEAISASFGQVRVCISSGSGSVHPAACI
jgi:nucleoside-diphosphate-sugar epimerase